MNRKKQAALASILLVIVTIGIISAALLLQNRPAPDNTTTNTATVNNATQAAATKTINVISTKSAFPFVQRWAAQYNSDQSSATLQVSYLEDVDVMKGGDLAIVGNVSGHDNAYIPLSAQAVAIVYNLPSFPDIPSGLKLNSSILSGILNSSITEWDDPAIKNLNQNLNLPNQKIVIFYDGADSKASEALLDQYLSTDAINWPKGSIATAGPDDLAAMVRKTPYSIGYVDFSYAVQTKMTFAAVANADGEYVVPSMDSIGQAVDTMQIQNVSSANQTIVTMYVINSSRFGNSSYPIVGLYYGMLSNASSNRNATFDFVRWAIDDNGGQQTLSEVQYPSIYHGNRSLIAYAEAIIRNNTREATKD